VDVNQTVGFVEAGGMAQRTGLEDPGAKLQAFQQRLQPIAHIDTLRMTNDTK
jgi:hypothetical protein